MNPSDPKSERYLTREQLRFELNKLGYPLSSSYFSKICLPSKNQGPPVSKWFGKRPLYVLPDGIAWAEARCTTTTPATAA